MVGNCGSPFLFFAPGLLSSPLFALTLPYLFAPGFFFGHLAFALENENKTDGRRIEQGN